MPAPAVARQIAFRILLRVADGAFASELLIEQTVGLDRRDAGLAAEITLGVLRRQAQLDWLIGQFSARPLDRLDPEVAIALRMAAYQIRFLDRVPPYAAVNDSLNLLRQAKKGSATGFANAVLRKIGVQQLEIPRGLGVPPWLLTKWNGDFGPDQAAGIAEASLHVPLLYQRVPAGCDPPDGADRTEVEGAFRVTAPDPKYRVQDISSQAIVPLLELGPQDWLLDVCAAPGNKTLQAREATGYVVASDLSPSRFSLLRSSEIPLVVADATRALPFGRRFNRILVDAPCSGTGTLAHNPEIKWRLQPGDFHRFAARQKRILRNALELLAPDGILVYSTCSVEPEENEHVAAAVAGSRVQREIRRTPGRDPGDGFYAAVIR